MCRTLPISPTELNIEFSVVCGQTFRWFCDSDGWWSCVLWDALIGSNRHVRVRSVDHAVEYETSPDEHAAAFLREYFRLEVDLTSLLPGFARTHHSMASAVNAFPGLRVLRQDPVECLFSFICSSAAPLHRIRKSIHGMCRAYGEHIDPYPGAVDSGHFSFPTIESLMEAPEDQLRAMGLGFRATYVREAALRIHELGGAAWLRGLRGAPYDVAKSALMTLPGVGDKIADCVCLFSLDKDDAIPVDTHVRQIAGRCFGDALEEFGLRPKNGDIAKVFRDHFPQHAGWAQQYLFFQDLYNKGSWATYVAQHTRTAILRNGWIST